MRIIFDLRSTGLGNNGGSQTLVKSGNTLKTLGEDVVFIDTQRNQYTWDKLECEHIIIKNNKQLPNADVIIATGYKSVIHTINAPILCGTKYHWIRAWEDWQYSEGDILQKVLFQPTIKLVNSFCLEKRLLEYDISSYIIRPGYDFDLFFPMEERQKLKSLVIGGLYRAGIHGDRKRTLWILKAVEKLKKQFDIKLFMFGSEKNPNLSVVDKYCRMPSLKEKNIFYNSIDIWISPTMSEGLHIPPGEAMLTKCCVVGTNAPLSGMQDYLVHNQTGIVTENNFESFYGGIITVIKDFDKRVEFGENGRNKILSLGDRKQNMKKLIEILKRS